MENKLTWTELKKQVVQHTHLSDKEVNLILSAWLDEMTAALKRGEEVHITGLGTFKMKTMKARKSVNVTTGEAIILPETDRLTYTMSAGLEEGLRGDAPSKLVAGIDPIQKLSEQADEIMDILGEMGMGEKAPDRGQTDRGQADRGQTPRAIPTGAPDRQSPGALRGQSPEKKERLWLTAGITVLVFIGLMIGLFFFFQHKLEQWLMDLRAEAEMVEVVEVADDSLQVTEPAEPVEPVEQADSIEQVEPVEPVEQITNYREYTEFIGEEQMHQDSRLAWMAYRYYGNKKLWVFIYDANKDHIANPENIAVGTPIRVPKLSQEILDYGEDIQTLVEQMYKEFIAR